MCCRLRVTSHSIGHAQVPDLARRQAPAPRKPELASPGTALRQRNFPADAGIYSGADALCRSRYVAEHLRKLYENPPRLIDLAGAPGFEPGITGPKPVALPLGHAPMPA